MTAEQILDTLRALSIEIHYNTDAERLELRPEHNVPPHLVVEISTHRGEIRQRIVPVDRRGYSHKNWQWRIARLERDAQQARGTSPSTSPRLSRQCGPGSLFP